MTRIRSEHPDVAVVMVSGSENDEDIETALESGATAYVHKAADPEDLVTAVRQALRQSLFFARNPTSSPVRAPASRTAPVLTRRELEILRLAAEGISNGAIARKLWVTEQTVKFHLSNIYRKLGVSNRTEASRYAQIHGLLGDATPHDATRQVG